ncbi:rod-binding protein [Kiloniella laminariae]|uniref:Rod-binding protein n=1 Tax=Kiloniella laminariae TaxID=454162 RepID=A0ABT4LHD0_9PROT|nr:rod-binding protein [Kiloniella laminariae]MCZ4280499.1 rod-binding protein [Kiloniella laminariae]
MNIETGNFATQSMAQNYMDGALGNNLSEKAAAISRINPKNEQAARAAAEDFEAVFLTQMLTPMFESLPTDGPMGGGSGEKVFRSLLVQEYGKSLSKAGGVGISDAVYREIIRMQEV